MKSRPRRSRKEVKCFPRWLLVVAILLFGVVVSIPILSLHAFKYLTGYNLVIRNASGDLDVVNFDSPNGEITRLTIPGNTQLAVSRQLGSWKAKSIWQLGENEDLGGMLLQETVLKNLSFPVTAWADTRAQGFTQGNLGSMLGAIFSPYKTNMSLGDKFKVGLLSLRLMNKPVTDINLAETSFLKQVKLVDGEDGYLVVGDIPLKISAIFAEDRFSQKPVRVVIKTYSANQGVVDPVGKVVEVLGAKVTATTREDSSDFDCRVSGTDNPAVLIFSSLFGCTKVAGIPGSNFDVEIDLGEKIISRF